MKIPTWSDIVNVTGLSAFAALVAMAIAMYLGWIPDGPVR